MKLAAMLPLLAATCLAPVQAADQAAELTDQGLEAALNRAEELARSHRYQEVVDLLEPYSEVAANAEARYALSAELGRAHFHLGRYREAHEAFRRSAALHPERVETGLYLEATSFITGNREQALAIFREILRSGARDLYLAVTLPGERAFLQDPEVWRLLEANRQPASLDLEQGRFLGVELGQTRASVVAALGVPEGSPTGVLSAHAGPKLLWALSFDDEGRLTEILVHGEHVLKYSAYRLDFGTRLDWRASPEVAAAVLGPPVTDRVDRGGDRVLTWTTSAVRVELAFGPPEAPRPAPLADGVDLLRLITLRARGATGSASMRP